MKKLVGQVRLIKAASMGAMAMALAGAAVPALAQDNTADARLRKLEAEIRALQRKVFPGPNGTVFQPEITKGTAPATTAGQPATSAVTDLLNRVQTLEGEIARLTGQIEQNANRIAQLEARGGGLTVPPTVPPGTTPPGTTAPGPTPAPAEAPAPTPAPQANLNAMSGGASVTKAAVSGPPSSRLTAVSGIEKPQSNDPGDDEYSYGYRLWDAKFFPEAQQQLKLFVTKYPKHARISYGRNLLGRAYLDAGNSGEAAKWFLQNYQADKSGGRAPDSLLYLGISMKELKDTKRACIALAEFAATYPAEAAGRLKSQYGAARNGLKCS